MRKQLPLICKTSQLEAGRGLSASVIVDGQPLDIAVFLYGGSVVAYLNVCAHQGRPLNWAENEFLFDEQGHLVCAHHGACFDLRSGVCTQGPCRGASLNRMPVEIVGDEVIIASGA